MTKRSEDLDATRLQILQAVIHVVAESGLDALTVQEVARNADVAVRTIYNHFESRDALLAAALGTLADDTRRTVQDLVVAGDSPREELLAFVDAYQTSYEKQGTAVAVLMKALDVPGVGDVVTEIRTWRRQSIRRIVRDAHKAGLLRVSINDAVNATYLATAYATHATLVSDLALSPTAARSVLRTMVDRVLFDAPR